LKIENVSKGAAVKFNQGRGHGLLGKVQSVDAEADVVTIKDDRTGRILTRPADKLTAAK